MTELNAVETRANWIEVLGAVGAGREVSADGIGFAMGEIMSGRATDAQIAAFAFGIFAKGITPAELDAAATGMLSFASAVEAPEVDRSVDIVGTGGDGAHTVNISTMTSVLVAAAGVPVIKHGNRAASSKSGGADMLEALGVNITENRIIAPGHPDFLLSFVFAAVHHPAMRFAGPVRGQLGVPTLFNLLGPLTNPAQPPAGLIGCAFANQLDTMAGAYARRGQRVLVVRGSDGLDEITITGPTDVRVVENGTVTPTTVAPEDFGLSTGSADSLRGGDAAYNADVAKRFWNNDLEGPIRDAVLLNAAASIAVAEGLNGASVHEGIATGLKRAQETLESGLCGRIVTDIVSAG